MVKRTMRERILRLMKHFDRPMSHTEILNKSRGWREHPTTYELANIMYADKAFEMVGKTETNTGVGRTSSGTWKVNEYQLTEKGHTEASDLAPVRVCSFCHELIWVVKGGRIARTKRCDKCYSEWKRELRRQKGGQT